MNVVIFKKCPESRYQTVFWMSQVSARYVTWQKHAERVQRFRNFRHVGTSSDEMTAQMTLKCEHYLDFRCSETGFPSTVISVGLYVIFVPRSDLGSRCRPGANGEYLKFKKAWGKGEKWVQCKEE